MKSVFGFLLLVSYVVGLHLNESQIELDDPTLRSPRNLPDEIKETIHKIEKGEHLTRTYLSIGPRDILFYRQTKRIRYEIAYSTANRYLFDKTLETKVIIHGWLESASSRWVSMMTQAYLSQGDYNIIQVDWHQPATQPYGKSAYAITKVGQKLASFLFQCKFNPEKVHLIGFHMGAHIAAVASKALRESHQVEKKIARITALNPAGPLFQDIRLNTRNILRRDDAKIVDIVHTDRTVFGSMTPGSASVEFFPNGGMRSLQPCVHGHEHVISCAYRNAPVYFTESITRRKTAVQCTSWRFFKEGRCIHGHKVVFGEHLSENARGDYYLQLSDRQPFLGIV